MGSEEELAGADNNQGLPSTVVCGLFKTVEISFLFTLSDTIVFWRKKFSQKLRCFFEMWNDNKVPKNKLRKRSWKTTGRTTKCNRLGQVGVHGTGGTGTGGSPYCVEQDGTETGGCSDYVEQDETVERSLSTSTSQSTCSKVEQQVRELFSKTEGLEKERKKVLVLWILEKIYARATVGLVCNISHPWVT